jgi:hypothetical protein
MKRFNQALWNSESLTIPVFIGAFFYWYFTRLNGLDPRDVNWLLPFWHGAIDSAAHYLGWEYFRSAPILQWPLGRTPNLGPGSGSSISMTDSIPLMAFLFKPFTHWYQGTFQYFGIWTLICFVLQSVASWKLIGIWVKDQFARGLACCFFVVTPAFLDRLTFQLGISSHWVILFALYLFFKKNFSLKLWIILGVVATLVQPYLAIMVSVVFFFALMGNSHFLKRLFVYVLSVFFAAYQAGLFVFGSSNVGSDGFGVYSANAFALVDPGFIAFDRAPWSTWVPDVRENGGQYEGFAFLGSGVLSIAVVLFIIQLITVRKSKVLLSGLIALPALINFVISQNAMSVLALLTFVLIAICVIQLQQYAKRDRLMVVKVCCIVSGFSLFALSNIILVGDFNFFQYEIPKYFLDRFAIARTSGRFIWLPMYFVMTVVLVAALKLFPRRAGMSLLCVALFFQISDSSQATRFISDAVTRPGADNYLPSKTWTVLGSTYKSVKFVPAAHFPRLFDTNPDFLNTSGWLWRDIGVLGQRYGWRLNSFYFGRVPETGFLAENTELNENLATGDYDRSVLYIFVGSEEWELAKKTVKNTDLIGTLDGVPIIAPGLSDCSVCDFSSFSNRSPFGSVG